MDTIKNEGYLLEGRIRLLYERERSIGGMLRFFKGETTDRLLSDGLDREAYENKRRCARLEGLLVVLERRGNGGQTNQDSIAEAEFFRQVSCILKRIMLKHNATNYRCAVSVARMQHDTAAVNLLTEIPGQACGDVAPRRATVRNGLLFV